MSRPGASRRRALEQPPPALATRESVGPPPGPLRERSRAGAAPAHASPNRNTTPRSPSPRSPAHQPDGHFEWLQCTRYRPPKLPRSRRRDGPAQRRLPRIPFSLQQVAVLEARFSTSQYLSSADVSELSAQLELPEARVREESFCHAILDESGMG
ncbi:Segmentation polarity homeobox protein engrailed [Frankliniella fusca]|uniref:Segmentation polarity homeobox protein engrailed n=1 Tax=Frankliniella fusca TaxID=407009 RepID=A0AAE1HLN5_9NEOP|nr:Segmentation polarity homeobox protein engrailed [Frankliniella fusca]